MKPNFPGWHLIGAYPDGDPGDVGSWLLHSDGEAMLLEVPEGLAVRDVKAAVRHLGVALRFVTASHDHLDHLDQEVWQALAAAFPVAKMIHPSCVHGDRLLHIGGEPVWLIKAPKHSSADIVTVFRGVAMTGDIELGTLESVNAEVPERVKKRSMKQLGGFAKRTGYHIHSVFSAHLNDIRSGINWPELFTV